MESNVAVLDQNTKKVKKTTTVTTSGEKKAMLLNGLYKETLLYLV